jgi:hypothetical protein
MLLSSGSGMQLATDTASVRSLGSRALNALETDRGAWTAAGIACVISVAVMMWVTRGSTFFVDDLSFFNANRGFDLQVFLSQHNGHLVFVPRLAWAIIIKLFGADFTVFRLLQAVTISGVGLLVFALAKRRVGGAVALALMLPLLFFGAGWDTTMTAVGIPTSFSVLFGLASIWILTSSRRYADPLAAFFLLLSVSSFSAGLAFAVGVAVVVLYRPDRWRRAWVFVVPLGIYGAWYAFKPGLTGPLFGSGQALHLDNILIVPQYVADAAAAVAAGIGGVGHSYVPGPQGSPPNVIDSIWGPVLAGIAILGLIVAMRRARPAQRMRMWPWIAVLVSFWASIALALIPLLRLPDSSRYAYPAAAAALVLAGEAAACFRISRRAIAVLFGLVILALGANLATMRQAGIYLRNDGAAERAGFAAMEIARHGLSPDFIPAVGPLTSPFTAAGVVAHAHLAAVDRNGSFAYTVPELQAAPEEDRVEADQILAQAHALRLQPVPPPTDAGTCTRVDGQTASRGFQLPRGGAVLRSSPSGQISLRRFGDTYGVHLGQVPSRSYVELGIPQDLAPQPWFAQIPGASEVSVCPLP